MLDNPPSTAVDLQVRMASDNAAKVVGDEEQVIDFVTLGMFIIGKSAH